MSCFKILVMNKIINYIIFIVFLNPSLEQFQYIGVKRPNPEKEEWRSIVVIEFDAVHVCSGSLVDREFVLTAAHCVDKNFSNNAPFKNSNLSVRIGGTINELEDIVIPVDMVYFHPDYNLTAGVADIAMLKLKYAVKPTIKTLNLPTAQLTYGAHCHLIGWKDLEYDQSISKRISPIVPLPKRTIYVSEQALMDHLACEDALREINLEIYKEEMPEKSNLISPKSICTKWKSSGLKMYDNYTDSGGPILCDKELHGVHSFQLELKDSRIFYISTRVDRYIRWIHNITERVNKYHGAVGTPQIYAEEDLIDMGSNQRRYFPDLQDEIPHASIRREGFVPDSEDEDRAQSDDAEKILTHWTMVFVLCGLKFL